MASLTVSSTKDFSSLTLANITILSFTNIFGEATATFTTNQFGSQISNAIAVNGSPFGDSRVVVNGSILTAEGWSFTMWGSGDSITLNGTGGVDTLTGSSQSDTINAGLGADEIRGGLGADVLRGSSGNDVFTYSAAEAVGTETLDGGLDADTLQVVGNGTFNFQAMSFTSLESVLFATDGASVVKLVAGQLGGPGDIVNIVGSAALDKLELTGSAIDLSGVTFINWSKGSDLITLTPDLAGIARGSAQNDEFRDFGQGAMTMLGEDGDDRFHYLGSGGSATGDVIAGGAGIGDAIVLDTFNAAALVDLSGLAALSGVERIEFIGSLSCTGTITDAQMASGITTIKGGVAADQFIIQVTAPGGGFNASALTLVDWIDRQDTLTLQGSNDDNTLIGSVVSDEIIGLFGHDLLRGGGGGDTLDGGSGAGDTLDYAGSDAVSVDIGSNSASGGDAEGDVIQGFENVSGGNSADQLTGGAVNNVLKGRAGNDALAGGDGRDNLYGGLGRDVLVGGAGGDVMTGDSQADRFVFLSVADSAVGSSRDVIADFQQGADRIDLSAIDTVAGGGDDPFIFRGTSGFGESAGLRFAHNGTQTLISGDVSGDRIVDFSVILNGLFTLTAADFVL